MKTINKKEIERESIRLIRQNYAICLMNKLEVPFIEINSIELIAIGPEGIIIYLN